MKQSVKSVLSALIAAGMLTAPAMAAFADVPSNAWYAKDVESVQSLGIIQGKENNQFDPDGTLTIAEAVTLAAKTHARDAGESIPAVAGAWYQGAVEYAQQSNIMTGTEFTDYTANATRAQMAYLFAHALPTANYTSINNIAALPDVTSNTPYNAEIFKLYNAGILSGSDDYGTFHPTDTITRAEAAAIINRLVDPSTRQEVTVKVPEVKPPVEGENIGEHTGTVYPTEGMTINGKTVTRDPNTGVLGFGGSGQNGYIYVGIQIVYPDGSTETIKPGYIAVESYDNMKASDTYTEKHGYCYFDSEWDLIDQYAYSKLPKPSAQYVGVKADINGNIIKSGDNTQAFWECKPMLDVYQWKQI